MKSKIYICLLLVAIAMLLVQIVYTSNVVNQQAMVIRMCGGL